MTIVKLKIWTLVDVVEIRPIWNFVGEKLETIVLIL